MPFLTLTRGTGRGRIDLIDRDSMVLGRSPSCDIQFTEPTVSRQHAQIIRDGKHYYLEDLGSQHGTLLNGERLRRRQRLKHADKIEMGECKVLFEEGMSPDPERTELSSHDSGDETSGTQVLDAVKALEAHRDAADQKLRAVLQIMHAVGISLDIEKILPAILESTLDVFSTADRGCIQLLDEDGRLQLAAARSRDGSIPQFDISQTLIDRVIVQGRAIVSDDAAKDGQLQSESVYRLNLRSLMSAPLVRGERTTPSGLIYVDSQDPRVTFTRDDLHVLITIANLAARGLGRARLHRLQMAQEIQQQDQRMARDLQLHFLPQKPPEVEGYQLASFYQSALNVGGDYFAFLPLRDGRVALAVADVAGKGTSAALVMARLCSDVRYSLAMNDQAADAIQWLNHEMIEADLYGRFVTMVLAILDPQTHRVQLANAGHPPPLLRTGAGVRAWEPCDSGPPLGVAPSWEYQHLEWQLEPGDCLLLYTDGANEATAPSGDMFGFPRIHQSLERSSDAVSAVNNLRDEVDVFTESEQQGDDLCILAAMRSK